MIVQLMKLIKREGNPFVEIAFDLILISLDKARENWSHGLKNDECYMRTALVSPHGLKNDKCYVL